MSFVPVELVLFIVVMYGVLLWIVSTKELVPRNRRVHIGPPIDMGNEETIAGWTVIELGIAMIDQKVVYGQLHRRLVAVMHLGSLSTASRRSSTTCERATRSMRRCSGDACIRANGGPAYDATR